MRVPRGVPSNNDPYDKTLMTRERRAARLDYALTFIALAGAIASAGIG
jgi:hypothetical protein